MKLKILFVIMLVLSMLTCLSACTAGDSYDEEWIIGKTSVEIEERYGQFERRTGGYGEDGLLRKCYGGYIIKEERQTLFGTTNEELFLIGFNEDGIATSTKTSLGGWGG